MTLTLDQARAIADGTLAKGRETDCLPLAVAVLDAGGHPKVVLREDGAGILRTQIAEGKAYGAIGLGGNSRAFGERLEREPATAPTLFSAFASMADGKVVAVPGGVLIRDADGAVVGAVGVSGDLSDKDEAAALGGLAAAGFST